jgi:hypothetical protein
VSLGQLLSVLNLLLLPQLLLVIVTHLLLVTIFSPGFSIEIKPWNMRELHGYENHQTIFTESCAYEAMYQGFENLLVVSVV